jgi:ABC-type Zn2+ transport system substrate-binding protein/surface adhesin
MKLKSLLKNKNFLYFVLFIAVVNMFGYLMMRETKAVILFALVGLLTSYFTKNMIIVLLSAIVVTNLYAGSILGLRIKEGMENHEEEEEEDEEEEVMETFEHNEDNKKKKKNKEKMTSLKPADYPPSGKKPKLDPSGTLEAAYDHLDKLLDSGALDKMSSETQNLAAQQDKLMKNIDKLEPMLSRAEGMMNNMGKMGGVKKRLEDMLGKSE